MKLRITELVETIGKKPIPPGTTHLQLEMLVSDEEGEDIDVSAFPPNLVYVPIIDRIV